MRKITFGDGKAFEVKNHQVTMSIPQTTLLHHIEQLPIFLSLAINKEDSLIAFQEEFFPFTDNESKRIR